MYSKILLASDGSDFSIKATEKVVELVNGNKDVFIEIIYVINPETAKHDVLGNGMLPHKIELERKQRLLPVVTLLEEASLNYQLNIVHGGDISTSIIKRAKDANFELIVLGTKGRTPIKKFLLGSVSYEVSRKAHCSVLVVR